MPAGPVVRDMARVKLRHYSAKAFEVDCAAIDPTAWATRNFIDWKPPPQHVLWLSVGMAWIRWVKSEMPSWLPRYKRARVVEVDQSRLIVVDTLRKARMFNKKYGHVVDGMTFIDWGRVVHQTSGKKCGLMLDYGILDDVALESRYGEFAWANTFDVSSAVVWSPECLTACAKA